MLEHKRRYINEVRWAVDAVISDPAELPDIESLVKAYLLFPGRREVQAILVRTGRMLYVGGGWEKFIEFQRTYANRLYEEFNERPALRSITGVDDDPVSYVATTYLESSVALQDGEPYENAPIGYERSKIALDDKSSRAAIDLLKSCPETQDAGAIRREIPRMIYAARIKSMRALLENDSKSKGYDAKGAIQEIENKIQELNAVDLVWLFQNHTYQEFLDFKIATTIHERNLTKKKDHSEAEVENAMNDIQKDHSEAEVENAMNDIRRLLSLRMTVSIDNEIRWVRPPQKLDTFLMFMVKGGIMDIKRSQLLPYVNKSPKMKEGLEKIFNAPVFEKFLKPEAWYKSTPLGCSGVALRNTIEGWLKKGW